MKRLYIIRHAKSSWSDPTLSDFDRKLNKRGKKDAPFMGTRLARYGIMPDAIYASPAKRARKTARAIAKRIAFPHKKITFDESIYSSSTMDLLNVLQRVSDRKDIIFLVGHNYAITDLAVELTDADILNIPTSGIVGIDLRIESWAETGPGTGDLLFFDYPKKHGDKG